MLDHSQAIEKMKKILYKHLELKALKLGGWSIEVDKEGLIDGQLASQILHADTLRELNIKYIKYLKRHVISTYSAFLVNRQYFPETNIDVEYKDDIRNVIEFLREVYPEYFL